MAVPGELVDAGEATCSETHSKSSFLSWFRDFATEEKEFPQASSYMSWFQGEEENLGAVDDGTCAVEVEPVSETFGAGFEHVSAKRRKVDGEKK